MSAPELTILTVCFGSADWIRLNFERFSQNNPGTPVDWIFVENDESLCALPTGENVKVVEGPGAFPPGPFQGSLHHAAGLQKGLEAVRTRYLLVLDPDFFPVTRGWAKTLLASMKSRGLAVLGAEWEPGDFTKPKGVPAPHFLLVDTVRVPKKQLDFTPDPERTARVQPLKRAIDSLAAWTGRHRTAQWLRRLLFTGSSHDTGSRISYPSPGTELLRVARKNWGTRWLDEVEWEGKPFAVHLRQVRAREGGEPWTLEAGKRALKEAAERGPGG